MAHFNKFTSKASGSLGASEPSERVVSMALERTGPVTCVTIPDGLAMQAHGAFAGKELLDMVSLTK